MEGPGRVEAGNMAHTLKKLRNEEKYPTEKLKQIWTTKKITKEAL
jgi:hypothetical protein